MLSKKYKFVPVVEFVLQHTLQYNGVGKYLDKIKLFPTENIEDRFPVDVFCENSSERHRDHCSQIHACTIGMITHFVICAAYRFSNEIIRKKWQNLKRQKQWSCSVPGVAPTFHHLVSLSNDQWSLIIWSMSFGTEWSTLVLSYHSNINISFNSHSRHQHLLHIAWMDG